ncbi:hypothetical protein ZOSMA_59G00670 [Zostera marina]|uniref:Uncharacterized protein n=1 Tax=Zostera marina TaxID=29655 RepID=A0A0K9NX22_ZOSMR|nr:hypothetical protein ZOSMA_59G00670 [Zostera marina]
MKGEEIRPLVEIDFLGLDQKPQHHQPPPPVRSNFVKSIKGIQEAVSLDLLRYVISGHNDPQTSLQLSQTPIRTASFGFLYNGSNSVFQTTTDTAEDVMKMTEKEKFQQQRGLLMNEFNPTGDMPLFRTQSLQRFFQKRRERLKSVAPYPTREQFPRCSSTASSCSSNC